MLKNVPDVGYLRPMRTQYNKSSRKKLLLKINLMLDSDPWELNETNLLAKTSVKNVPVPDVGYIRPMRTQWNKSSRKKLDKKCTGTWCWISTTHENSMKQIFSQKKFYKKNAPPLMYIYDLWELKQIFSQNIMLKKCDDVGYLRPCLQYLIAEFSGEVVFFATWMFPPSADLNRKNS
jgi:hypothetical protein